MRDRDWTLHNTRPPSVLGYPRQFSAMSQAGVMHTRSRTRSNLLSTNSNLDEEIPISRSSRRCASRQCEQPRGQSIDWVQCDECARWYHIICVGITVNTARNEDFKCTSCEHPSRRQIRRKCGTCGKMVCVLPNNTPRTHGPLQNRCQLSGTDETSSNQDSVFTAEEILQFLKACNVKTLKYVPRASRVQFADAIGIVISDVCKYNNCFDSSFGGPA